MKEITRYQASWGAWYVQVMLDDDSRVELKFDQEPTWAEIEPVAKQVLDSMQPLEPTIEVIAEDGVVL